MLGVKNQLLEFVFMVNLSRINSNHRGGGFYSSAFS